MQNSSRVKGAGSVVLACLLAACAGGGLSRDAAGRPAPTVVPGRPAAPVTLGGIAFHSMQWQVKLRALPAGASATALQQELQAALDDLDAALSTYRPDSELMRFNAAPVGEWVAVSPVLLQSLQVATDVSRLSEGAYDVTVGPLVELWGFGAHPAPAVQPAPASVAAARARVGWQHIEVDAAGGRLRRTADVAVDLSSLGEGAGADALAVVLEARGVHDYLAGVAGTSRQRGQRPGGGPWGLVIEQPDGSGATALRLLAPDSVVSTSGAYRNIRVIAGKAFSHTIDPATGYPVRHGGVMVTLVLPAAGGAMRADALATALNVLGPERGLALAAREGWAVRYVERDGSGLRVRGSPAFQAFAGE